MLFFDAIWTLLRKNFSPIGLLQSTEDQFLIFLSAIANNPFDWVLNVFVLN